MEFNIGDLVQLKSGSPKMVVNEITEHNSVICLWYNYNLNKYDTFPFQESVLLKVENLHDSNFLGDVVK